jgi:hypothetical protein
MTKRDSESIYVALLDEGIDVWLPVMARRLPNGTYLILEQDYDRSTEAWQFEPGSIVKGRVEKRNGRQITVAEAVPQSAIG